MHVHLNCLNNYLCIIKQTAKNTKKLCHSFLKLSGYLQRVYNKHVASVPANKQKQQPISYIW